MCGRCSIWRTREITTQKRPSTSRNRWKSIPSKKTLCVYYRIEIKMADTSSSSGSAACNPPPDTVPGNPEVSKICTMNTHTATLSTTQQIWDDCYDNNVISVAPAPCWWWLLCKLVPVHSFHTLVYTSIICNSRQGILHTGHLFMYSRGNRIADIHLLSQMLVTYP